jgi:hypothetical protein
MTQPPSFEQKIESDMHQLAAEIQRNREHPEFQHAGERALIKESLRAFPQPGPADDASEPPPTSPSHGPLPAYADSASPEVKLEIEYLIDVALKQGIGKALAESQKSPYFVQDAFHDALAGKLYPELQRRGIVK